MINLVHLKISPSPMVQVLQCIMILLLLYITCQRFQLYSIAIHGGQISIYCTYRSLTWRKAAQDKTQTCSKYTPHDNDTEIEVKDRFRSYLLEIDIFAFIRYSVDETVFSVLMMMMKVMMIMMMEMMRSAIQSRRWMEDSRRGQAAP